MWPPARAASAIVLLLRIRNPQAGRDSNLESPRLALARRQDLETGGPPARENRFDELLRKLLLAHVTRQPLVVIRHGDELDLERSGRSVVVTSGRQEDVPDVGAPVVRRPAQGADV